jgi:DNA-3-methyladenine glycosylase II
MRKWWDSNPRRLAPPVFKTGAIDRYATLPLEGILYHSCVLQFVGMTVDSIKKHFRLVDPVISQVIEEMPLEVKEPDLDFGGYFYHLARSIVGQQLSGKAAETIFGRFLKLFDDEVTPEKVTAIDDQKLRDSGLSWSKVKYINHLAEMVSKEELPLAELPNMDDQDIIKELTKVKGIGQWTVEMFLMFVLGRPNIFSHGDLGLLRGLQKLYGLGEKPTKAEIEAIIKKWEPYQTYGSRALWHSLDNR